MLKNLARVYAERSLNNEIFNRGLIPEDMFIQVDKALLSEIDAIERHLYGIYQTSCLRGADNAITSNEAAIGKW